MREGETLKKIAKDRMVALAAIRSFFVECGFIEIEAPLLVASPDMEPTLDHFEIEDQALISSPEYSMKKLLGSGFEKIFNLGKVFRNEPSSELHQPEFTMLEWYVTGVDYKAGMEQTEALVRSVASALGVSDSVLLGEWEKKSVRELFGVDVGAFSRKEIESHARSLGVHVVEDDSWSDIFYRIFLEKIEPKLPRDRTLIVYDYPIPQAALARKGTDPNYAERFEVYAGGVELCNAFTELTDADEQRKRFEEEKKERVRLGKRVWPIDEELLRMLPSIPNPTFGNALGVDRLLMVLLGAQSINDILLYAKSK